MTDSVTRSGKIESIPFGNALQVLMIVRISEIGLQCVVIHETDTELSFYAVNADGLKLEIGHGSRGILCEGIVNFQGHFLPCNGFSLQDMPG